ncbi:MAG: PD-(D/E)XK nuclease family protein, partial [Gaiellaceae bacterium]
MGLALVVGPAHAGKVALLLERYVDALERDPWLVVPNRLDIERVERDLLRRRPALLAGRIGTFDDLFEHVVADEIDPRRVASEAQRALAARRAIAATDLDGLGSSASTRGFAETLLAALSELESALLDPDELEGDLADLVRAYRLELGRLDLHDRPGLRRAAVARLRQDLDSWHGEPVFAYGFEDLTAAEWALLETLAGRTEVTVSIPYEPGRAAFAALERTVEDLAGLAAGAIEELPRTSDRVAPAPLLHLERELFADTPPPGPALDGSLRFLEGAGARGTAALLASELVDLLRAGSPPDRVAVVCDSPERWRAPLGAAFDELGVPYAIEHPTRLAESALGGALLALLRFAWFGGDRGDLFAFLRSPYSGLERRSVDFVEGRLRGRAVSEPTRVEEEAERLRGAPIPALVELRNADNPVAGARALLTAMLRNAWGLVSPPVSDDARLDARAHRAVERVLDDLAPYSALAGPPLTPEDVIVALERATVRPPASGDTGHVAVLDYERARTRTFDAVFLLGLEEGAFPRRARPSPLLDDDARRALGGRLERTDSIARDRYLFYTACTRAGKRLVLVREAATDEGAPREASPFWDDVASLFDAAEVARATRRRALSALTWTIESAPSERQRLRAVARLAVDDANGATSLAEANGWSRRLDRARNAFERPTSLTSAPVVDTFAAKSVFSATELERFADCSSAWLVERVLDPKRIDAEPDAILRGQVVHTTLNRFYASVPRELDSERVTPENLEAATALVHQCLDDAIESGVRLDLTDLQ